MQPAPQWIFGPFRLDLDNACLWHGTEMISLPPTLLTLLHYLVTHAGQLVTKEELLAAVWPETAVGDAVGRTVARIVPSADVRTARTVPTAMPAT